MPPSSAKNGFLEKQGESKARILIRHVEQTNTGMGIRSRETKMKHLFSRMGFDQEDVHIVHKEMNRYYSITTAWTWPGILCNFSIDQ